jgi:sugar phosphate isomerase/epimerase
MSEPIGFRTAGYRRLPVEDALRSIAAAGYDGVEVCLEHPDCLPDELTPARCRELARLASDLGLAVASVSYHGDRDGLQLRWARALRAVALTPEFGTDLLIINSPRPGPRSALGLERQFLDQLWAQLAAAEELGVTLALEPEPGLLVSDCADMRGLLERAQSSPLAVNLDVGHAFLTEADITRCVTDLGAHIVHTHFEDMPAGEHRHLIPGEGDMDLPAVLVALRGVGYAGYLTVDLFDIADAPEQAARLALTRMRELVS